MRLHSNIPSADGDPHPSRGQTHASLTGPRGRCPLTIRCGLFNESSNLSPYYRCKDMPVDVRKSLVWCLGLGKFPAFKRSVHGHEHFTVRRQTKQHEVTFGAAAAAAAAQDNNLPSETTHSPSSGATYTHILPETLPENRPRSLLQRRSFCTAQQGWVRTSPPTPPIRSGRDVLVVVRVNLSTSLA